jgi:hypothetical protein
VLVIPALRRQRWENREFQSSLEYIEDPISNQTKQSKKGFDGVNGIDDMDANSSSLRTQGKD